jgi:acyl-CoA thioesterase-2
MDDWIWQYMRPETISGGRGWYTGALYTPDGTRVASIAQEALFRKAATT